MRLLICAGGTGGGVYPALSVLKQIMSAKLKPEQDVQAAGGIASAQELQVLWVGGTGGMEADLVKREGVRFETIPAAGVHGVSARALPGNLWQLTRGFLASRRLLRKFQPDVLFFTGGFIAVPMAMAARLSRRTRSLLFVPDIEPGMAIKAIARFSDCISLSVDESSRFFTNHPQKVVTGYPLRPGLDSWTISEARDFFALKEEMPVLLVLGGSKGARSINQAVVAALPTLLEEMQVIHISGRLDWQMIEQSRASLTTDQLNRYRPYSYLHEEIGAAFRLSDLAITRAGASTLGELPAFGLPAILVPYPYAWHYQRVNASYLVRRGAAIQIEDAQLAAQIVPRVHDLISDKDQLQKMSSAMHSLVKPDAALNIARLLRELAANTNQTGSQIAPGSTG